MKLPLDHFRVLGIKPGVNTPEIEQALIERLRNPPSEGYSLETLDARAELLRASAAFLMDEQRCRSHERQLATIPGEDAPDEDRFSGTELELGQEIVVPLLLLEAQDNFQAFDLALELLSPRGETAAFRGHQQVDLLLMAALAARRASQQMWTKRLYDQSAQILERIIQVMGQYASQARRKAILEDDLYKIAPFQVLDLLSQESCTSMDRQRALRSLKALIDHRGGLDVEDDEQSSPMAFRDFFKQIRPCLTINEQLELFESYSVQGSSTANFLLAYTRTAAGFQRRQAAHVDAALAAMELMDVEGLEPEKACLLLLLGQPDAAQDMVRSCRDPHLCQWLASYPPTSDSLIGLCSFCSQWLERHVLPCYRDVDPHGKVDLDAYFLDLQVQSYIKDRDSRLATRPGPPESKANGANGRDKAKQTKDLALFTPAKPVHQAPQVEPARQQESLLAPPPQRWPDASPPSTASPAAKSSKAMNSAPVAPQRQKLRRLMAKGALVAGVTVALVALRPWSLLTTTARTPDSSPPRSPSPPPDAVVINSPPALPSLATPPTPIDLPRIQAVQDAEELDLAGVTTLLRAWLYVKASLLDTSPASQPSPDTLAALALLAVPEQVAAVLNQHESLRERGEQLDVRATLGDVSLLAQTPSQVSARVVLTYAESTRDAGGATTNTLGPKILRNDYTFIRGQQGWKLLRFSPSPSLGIASR